MLERGLRYGAICALFSVAACVTDGSTFENGQPATASPGAAAASQSTIAAQEAADTYLGIKLLRVVGPGAADSVTGGRPWNEFQVVVTNLSAAVVTLNDLSLVDGRGVFIKAAASGYEFAPTMDDAYREANQDMAVMTATGAAGMLAGTFIPIPGVAQATMATGLLAPEPGADTAAAMNAAIAAFNSRAIQPRTALDAGGKIAGSVFFPQTADPKFLVVSYRAGAEERNLRLAFSTQ